MFDIAPTELLLVAMVALIVIGPKDLPKAMRFVGHWVGKARGVARQFRSGFDTMVREAELADMEKAWKAENERIMREHPPEPAAALPPSAAAAIVASGGAADTPDKSLADDADQPPLMVEQPTIKTDDAGARADPGRRQSCRMTDIDVTQAPLLDHLIELRRRLLYCALAIAVCFGIGFYFAKEIFAILAQPLVAAGQDRVIFTKVFEAFFVQIKVAFFAAMMMSFPVIANQLWQFVAPGLYRNEKGALLPFLLATPILFGTGASLAYFVAIPVALTFLLSFQGDLGGGLQQEAMPAIGEYLSFVMQFLFAFGISFLLPVLLMLMERAGLVTRKQLVGARRYAIVGAFGIAAVLTPPDVGSQLLLAIPLVILYELALIGIWFTERKRAKVADAAEA